MEVDLYKLNINKAHEDTLQNDKSMEELQISQNKDNQ